MLEVKFQKRYRVTGFPLRQFYRFGSDEGDSILPSNDDESTPRIDVSVPFPFFGSSYSSIYVNNNGDVTFDTALTQFTADAFPINGSHKMIAAFWTDIDTALGGSLWYRTSTDSSILQKGTQDIRTVFPSLNTFSATWMMIITWNDVAAYGCSDTGAINCQQRNTFQLVLISNGVHSFAVFMYNVINWTNKAETLICKIYTLIFKCYTLICKLYTLICKIPTLICKIPTLKCKIHSLICKFYTSKCKIHTLMCKIHTLIFKFQILFCKFYTLICKMYTLICKIQTFKCKIHTLICKLYTLICKFYTLICKFYTLICKIHTEKSVKFTF
uniref:Sushi, nidogen and EGF-like domain-containing protein 1 n=1 Tax=Magallana gigas TaxID=29159 RepID=K1RGC6_MAGGI